MTDICEIVVYTDNSVLTFDVKVTCSDFVSKVSAAFEEGVVVLDTAEDTQVVISALNVVAIEIKEKHPPA